MDEPLLLLLEPGGRSRRVAVPPGADDGCADALVALVVLLLLLLHRRGVDALVVLGSCLEGHGDLGLLLLREGVDARGLARADADVDADLAPGLAVDAGVEGDRGADGERVALELGDVEEPVGDPLDDADEAVAVLVHGDVLVHG